MQIREMSMEDCGRMLAGARLARVACAHEDQPYVVPMYFAYDDEFKSLYGFTFPGRKVEWMRANPRVCIEVDEIIAGDRWMSLIGIGRYEELPPSAAGGAPRFPHHDRPSDVQWDDRDGGRERERAWQLLQRIHSVWFEPSCIAWAARVHRDATEPAIPIYFRIRLDHVTGHQAIPDPEDATSHDVRATAGVRWARLRGTLGRVFGGRRDRHGRRSRSG